MIYRPRKGIPQSEHMLSNLSLKVSALSDPSFHPIVFQTKFYELSLTPIWIGTYSTLTHTVIHTPHIMRKLERTGGQIAAFRWHSSKTRRTNLGVSFGGLLVENSSADPRWRLHASGLVGFLSPTLTCEMQVRLTKFFFAQGHLK